MSATPWIIGGAVVAVGGYLLWRRSKQEAGPTTCERMAAAAGTVAGFPVSGDLAKTACSALGNPDSVWDLPGPSLFKKIAGLDGPCCCPEGSTRVHRSSELTSGGIVGFFGLAEDEKTYGLADHRAGHESSYSCVDKDGNTIGSLSDNGFVPYTPTGQPPSAGYSSSGIAAQFDGTHTSTHTTIQCVDGKPPAGMTWDVASNAWRRLRVGETTVNPGPCATPTPITTKTTLLRSASSPMLAVKIA